MENIKWLWSIMDKKYRKWHILALCISAVSSLMLLINPTLQKRLVESVPAELLDVDILKYPHHGIQALNAEFREAVSPLFAVITNQDYERMANTKQRLRQNEIPFAFTLKGPVAVCTDGTTWLVERLPIDPATIN